MQNPPSFTAVITSYNYRHFIAEAIDSALAQTYLPRQIVVVDDGSTDGSADFVRNRYGDNARVVLIAKENCGELAAFATGVAAADRNDVIALLDADDRWLPGYLSAVAKVYTERRTVDYVYANMLFFGSREGPFHKSFESSDQGVSVIAGSFRRRWRTSPTSAITLRRALAHKLLSLSADQLREWGTWADDVLSYGADILGAHKYGIGEPLVMYRAHDANMYLGQRRNRVTELRQWARAEAVATHFRAVAGIEPTLRDYYCRRAREEFLTKSRPLKSDLSRYTELVSMASMPWYRKLGHRWAMWRHFLKTRGRSA